MSRCVIVIGAGISGLAASLELQTRGIDVTIIEKSDRAGGPIQTDYIDDYIIDAGPDSFLSTKPGGLWFVDRLGLSDHLINTRHDGGGTFIVHDGVQQPLPEGITMLVPTQARQIVVSPLLSRRGKLRLLGDYVIPSRREDDDESVAAFMRRRVGQEAFERLAEPLLSGIFSGDASKLSIQATFPRLANAERQYGGLIRAAMAARRASTSADTRERQHTPFVSLRRGLGSMVDAAIELIGKENVRFETEALSIERSGSAFVVTTTDGKRRACDGVVVATPAAATARLIAAIAPTAARQLLDIEYVSSATVSMAFDVEDLPARLTGRGFVVPRVEGFDLTAATWSSRKFSGRTPDNRTLLRGFVGRAGNEGPAFLDDDATIDIVRRDLNRICGIRADPVFARVYRWHRAMPQYHVGHAARVATIRKDLDTMPGVELVGAVYDGVGIPDCISSATAIAGNLANQLKVSSGEIARA